MPSMKCPNPACGYKIILPSPSGVCPNCGTPISPATRSWGTATTTTTSTPLPGSSWPLPTPSPPAHPVPSGTPGTPATGPGYSTAAAMPFHVIPSPPMPSRPPELEGTIAIQPKTHEIKVTTDWSHMVLGCIFFPLLLFLRPLMLVMGLIGLMSRPERKMTINTIRIRRLDGTMREARLEGDLMGTGVSMGDDVSLWGHDRGGVLIVKQAYNHTTGGEIQIRPPTAPWVARVVAALLLSFLLLIILSILLSSIH